MLPSQRSLFNIPKDIIYMNTAYMSPLLNSVIHAINEGTQAKANPWKIKISDFYENVEEARFLFSQIVNTESSSIAIVPSASYGIETAAKNILLTANQNIVILDQQFPSNVYPWFRMAKENNATILFSPAAASFDQYNNFEMRGNDFKNLIFSKFNIKENGSSIILGGNF